MSALVDKATAHAPLLLRVFVVTNLAGVGADVYLAHQYNAFGHVTEWIPVAFSAIATLLVLPWMVRASTEPSWASRLAFTVFVGSIAVGALGTYYHLASGHGLGNSLMRWVYSAPFAAPAAYSGIGLLGLVSMQPRWGGLRREQWVLLCGGLAFLANGVLCVVDHAQNGYAHPAEWLSVVTNLIAGFGLPLAAVRTELGATERKAVFGLALCMVAVGLLGFALHMGANLEVARTQSVRQGFVFGAPSAAPLLLADAACVVLLGLLVGARDQAATASPPR
ncbi:MAG: hypothetical protein AB8I08_25725 [Sandaracinaceae bacterium]